MRSFTPDKVTISARSQRPDWDIDHGPVQSLGVFWCWPVLVILDETENGRPRRGLGGLVAGAGQNDARVG